MLIYKDGGPHSRPGGTYQFTEIEGDIIPDGWFKSLGDLIDGKKPEVEVSEKVEVQDVKEAEKTEVVRVSVKPRGRPKKV
jgi:hypothetical protein